MKKLNRYELVESCITRLNNIKLELKDLEVEYYPREVRGLVNEYKWTTYRVINLCNEILSREPEDPYGSELDNRIKIEKILDFYQSLWDNVLNKKAPR
tara:strand:+ start:427 stop:720 length:294 start_codon:yes stop_codon:yes gene_type:complete